MNRYLLDTNAWIAVLKNNPTVVARLRAVGVESLFLCAPVKAELWFGAWRSRRREENQSRLRRFFADLPSLPFDDLAAEECGRLRAELAARGTPVGPYDLQIAAVALAHGLTVVTHNTGEFSRIPGLPLEDWQK